MKDWRVIRPEGRFHCQFRKAVVSVLLGGRVHNATHLGFDGFLLLSKPYALWTSQRRRVEPGHDRRLIEPIGRTCC